MKKVGVITVHNNTNYGANLQAFASVRYLNSIGVDACLVDYTISSHAKCTTLLGWLGASWKNEGKKTLTRKFKLGLALLASAPWKARRLKRFASFRARHIPMTKACRNGADVAREGLDVVVVGSDQIWCPEITDGINPIFFGAIDGVGLKVSYAPSIGGARFTGTDEIRLKELIGALDYCSVREEKTAEYLSRVTGRNIDVVCDPVFLLGKDEYVKIESKRMIKGDYVLLYSVVHDDKLTEIAGKYARSRGLKLVEICTGDKDGEHTQVSDYGPSEFLSAFHHASVVFTNSFHGTAFSVIYEKEFFVVDNKHGGTRITNLLNKVGLASRLIEDVPERNVPGIDYVALAPHVWSYVERSTEFLKNALGASKRPLLDKGCTGCGACEATCRIGAVKLSADAEGFPTAYVDRSKCVDCGLCKAVCPACHEPQKCEARKVYAFKATDEVRKKSASGGASSALAKVVLGEGGVVYGASMSNNFEVRHVRVDSTDNLGALVGTKYVQSRTAQCYEQIEADLKDGKAVLFSGTPCQVDGVKRFVQTRKLNADRLFTVDIICHGVPSPAVFSAFVEWLENKLGEKLVRFEFRSKEISWRGESCLAETTSGKKVVGDEYVRAFMNTYYSGNVTREVCYDCKYATCARVGDVTVSDFWGIENGLPEFEDGLGVSMVMINTPKGESLFEKVEGTTAVADLAWAKQSRLVSPTIRPVTRDEARRIIKEHGPVAVVKKYGIAKTSFVAKVKALIKKVLGK